MGSMWIDGELSGLGEMGFLHESSNPAQGWTRYELREQPARTNISREPKLRGWCGETNNVVIQALGVWKVVRLAKNGRARIVEVTDREELETFLDKAGYPNLMPAMVAA